MNSTKEIIIGIIITVIVVGLIIWFFAYGLKKRKAPIINKTWESTVYTKEYKTIQDEGWDLPIDARLLWVERKLYKSTDSDKKYKTYYHYELDKWVNSRCFKLDGTYKDSIEYFNVDETDKLKVSGKDIKYYVVVETKNNILEVKVKDINEWNSYELDTVMTYVNFNAHIYDREFK